MLNQVIEDRFTSSAPPRKIVKPRPSHHVGSDHREEENDEGQGGWLVSYADLMTLLFGFFVIYTSFSTPNAQKFEQLKQATTKSMGGEYVPPLAALNTALKNVLRDFNLKDEVTLSAADRGMVFVSKGTLFFNSGSTQLRPDAKKLLVKMAGVFKEQAPNFRISIEGHTDNIPVAKKGMSNWELSALRASTVARLFEKNGVPHSHLRPVGLADTEPLVPNANENGLALPDNQAINRRVVIRVQEILENEPEN